MGFDRSARASSGAPLYASSPILPIVVGVLAAMIASVIIVRVWSSHADGPAAAPKPAATTTTGRPTTTAAATTSAPTTTAPSTTVAPPTTGPPIAMLGGPVSPPELSVAVLNTQSMELLQKPGVAATWASIGKATSDTNGPLISTGCDPAVPRPQTWAQDRFNWVDAAKDVKGEATSLVMHFATEAEAAAFVDLRRTPAFARCMAQLTSFQFAVETGGRPNFATLRQTAMTPIANGVALRYSGDFETPELRCKQFRDSYWVAAGTSVIAASLRTCGEPFASAKERALIQLQLAFLKA